MFGRRRDAGLPKGAPYCPGQQPVASWCREPGVPHASHTMPPPKPEALKDAVLLALAKEDIQAGMIVEFRVHAKTGEAYVKQADVGTVNELLKKAMPDDPFKVSRPGPDDYDQVT